VQYKGFTLVELLIVISIIGILTSVVLVSLNSTKNKAKINTVQQTMIQMRNVLEVANNSTAGYSNLAASRWIGTSAGEQFMQSTNVISSCDIEYGSAVGTIYNAGINKPFYKDPVYSAQMLAMCKKILSVINPSDSTGTPYAFGVVTPSKKFSINVQTYGLNSGLYCVGSSGANFSKKVGSVLSSDGVTPCTYGVPSWAVCSDYNFAGCYNNP
jgi:prepilin-type N-terminal cleavage/methylation domain-containing protein